MMFYEYVLLIVVVWAVAVLLNYVFKSFHKKLFTIAVSWWRSPLKRSPHNPIVEPVPHHEWENQAVFNPAALLHQGRVHLLYRAIGNDGVSRIGYASSADGVHFDERLIYPVYELSHAQVCFPSIKRFDPVLYPSGGSWGGCEDPRMTLIEDRVYLTFNAFDGWDYIRVGAVHIDLGDFERKFWKWSMPMMLSPQGEIHKNWVLFPEKIQGKFALLHSITPDVQVELLDRLEDVGYGTHKIVSRFGQKRGRNAWDTHVRGAGTPPLKTDQGWLLLYHATQSNDPSRYKIGAMLLDVQDPTKVIARSEGPLLSPDEYYENNWKPGVVYTCGAVIKDGELMIYYGGGDQTINVAHAPLAHVLTSLTSYQKPPHFTTEKTSL